MGTPNLDDPTDMAFLPNGDIVVTDAELHPRPPGTWWRSIRAPVPRTLISGNGRASGPRLRSPAMVAVEASGYILVTDVAAGNRNHRFWRSTRPPATASS